MKICPHCNASFPDSVATCPHDGRDLVTHDDPFSSASVRNVEAFTTTEAGTSTFSSARLDLAGAPTNNDAFDIGRPMVSDAAGNLSPDQAQAIFQAITNGNKIEAIRLFRLHTGVGLKEAKDAVENAEASGLHLNSGATPGDAAPAGTTGLSGDQKLRVIELLRSGQTIVAIKEFRDATGMGLKDSKAAVEAMARSEGIPLPTSKGCVAMLTGGIGVGLATWAAHHFLR